MALFESERDSDEIQEQLSIITNPTVSDDSVTTALPFGEGYEQRETKHADKSHKEETRYQPYSTTAPPQSSTSASASERETAKLEENMAKTSPGYKVFVANLAFSVTARSLEDHMARAGSVLNCIIFKHPNGSSRGMGICEYRDPESVERAIVDMKDTELEGRRIFVRKYVQQSMDEEQRTKAGIMALNRPNDRPRPPANAAATVYVNNLDYACTWQQLKDVFKAAGKIVYCEIQIDKAGRSKGMGSVQYERPIEALNAIALFHGQMMFNRALMVRMDNRSPIKPDPMTVKQVMGGGMSVGAAAAAQAYSGMMGLPAYNTSGNLMGLSATLGLSPELLQSLGVRTDQGVDYGNKYYSTAVHSNYGYGYSNQASSYQYPSSNTVSQYVPPYNASNYSSTPNQPSSSTGGQPTGNPPLSGSSTADNNYTASYQQVSQEYSTSTTTTPVTTTTVVAAGATTAAGGGGSNAPHYSTLAQTYDQQHQLHQQQQHQIEQQQQQIWQQQSFLYSSAPSSFGRRVVVRNLNFRTAWQKLKDLFRGAGNVQFVDIMQGSDGRPNGSAYILFDRPESATNAVSMFHNSELDGRKIEVQLDRMGDF